MMRGHWEEVVEEEYSQSIYSVTVPNLSDDRYVTTGILQSVSRQIGGVQVSFLLLVRGTWDSRGVRGSRGC